MNKPSSSAPLAQFFWQQRVYIEDTDAGGIVYYVNYLKFMERARTEMMRAIGFDKRAIFNQEAMFVVHSLQVDYKAAAQLDDMLQIEAHVLQLKRTSMLFQQNIYRASELLCAAKVKIACVSKDGLRPVAMPEPLWQGLQRYIAAQVIEELSG